MNSHSSLLSDKPTVNHKIVSDWTQVLNICIKHIIGKEFLKKIPKEGEFTIYIKVQVDGL